MSVSFPSQYVPKNHSQDEVHQVLEGRLAGERVIQQLLEHSKRVDVVHHRLEGDSVGRLSGALLRRVSLRDLRFVGIKVCWDFPTWNATCGRPHFAIACGIKRPPRSFPRAPAIHTARWRRDSSCLASPHTMAGVFILPGKLGTHREV